MYGDSLDYLVQGGASPVVRKRETSYVRLFNRNTEPPDKQWKLIVVILKTKT